MVPLRKTWERFYCNRLHADARRKMVQRMQSLESRKGPKTELGKSVTGRTSAEMLCDEMRLPCDILFGQPRVTSFSPNENANNNKATDHSFK
ncbi:hypothetical protein AVEN_155658-1 [Araneus ventricosus]|uniref:Uncharacterized protein n=1 Tax=Araneus ventricosus TaxID=182803 RepID=A0A4Y2RJE4_ARAVE|nr:hypothetical protein AVEN_155658-1 [Araneus ventricosus]